MHIVTVLLGTQSCWTFNFKNPADADKASKAIKKAKDQLAELDSAVADRAILYIEDDFGQKASMEVRAIAAWQVADLEKTLDAQGMTELFRARATARLQQIASKDPALMFANGQMPASGIIKPGPTAQP